MTPKKPESNTLPPRPPIAYGTMEKQNEDVCSFIERITTPIFNKVLQEPNKNRISVSGSVSVDPEKCLYNPHNCRAYFDFKKSGKKNFKPNPNRTPAGCVHKVVNSTEHNFKNFFNCTIRVRTKTIEIANQINPRWYSIEITTNSGKRISEIVQEKVRECENTLKLFIEMIGGHSDYKLLNLVLKDNKIQGEHAINQIPKKLKFHNRVGKKEYNERLFEFNSIDHVSNYLEVRAAEKIAPDIVHALESINPLATLKSRANNIGDLQSNEHLIRQLSGDDIADLELWIIKRFGVSG